MAEGSGVEGSGVEGPKTFLRSFVRGHHEYYKTWTPVIGQLLPVRRESSNVHDPFAVAVWKGGEVVGHAPKSLSKTMSFFLNYDGNVVFCEVTGPRVNRGVGLGMEVPCVYKFYGRRSHIKKLEDIFSRVH